MTVSHVGTKLRKGAIAPLAAMLAVFVLGVVAFALDTGWIVLAKAELQSAADSAALAGASQLIDGYVQYQLPGQTAERKTAILNATMTSARTAAKKYAQLNTSGGVSSLTLKDTDIEFGFLDKNNAYTSLADKGGFPNTIKVLMRRDKTANGSLNLFFAPALGTKSTNLNTTASATIYAGVIKGFSSGPNQKIGMLPMTYDVNDWNNFVSTGKDPNGATEYDAAGNPVLKIYSTVKDTGNFGELALDDEHAGSSEIRGWVNNGMASSDLTLLKDRGLLPVSTHDNTKWDWLGNTGFKSTTVQEVNDLAGTTYLLPLFLPKNADPKSYQPGIDEGSNYAYNIVRFVGIKIIESKHKNREITIQPTAFIEPNAVFDSLTLAPAGSDPQFGSTLVTTFATPKLTR
jgi:Flp pilus assembly protein TadG